MHVITSVPEASAGRRQRRTAHQACHVVSACWQLLLLLLALVLAAAAAAAAAAVSFLSIFRLCRDFVPGHPSIVQETVVVARVMLIQAKEKVASQQQQKSEETPANTGATPIPGR